MGGGVLTATRPVVVLREWRCPGCGALLAKLVLTPGSVVQIRCGRCKTTATKEAA